MASIRARQTGSAFTAWTLKDGAGNNKILALCQEVTHRSPQPVTGAVEVHPLNYVRPTEIIVPRAITHGEITMTVLETFDNNIWGTLRGVFGNLPAGVNDLADFFAWMMTSADMNDDSGSKLALTRVVRNPNSTKWRQKTFKNARIVDIRDEESATVDSLVNPLSMTVWYTSLVEEEIAYENEGIPIKDPVWGTTP